MYKFHSAITKASYKEEKLISVFVPHFRERPHDEFVLEEKPEVFVVKMDLWESKYDKICLFWGKYTFF